MLWPPPSSLDYDKFTLEVQRTLKGEAIETVDVVIATSSGGKPVQVVGQAPAFRGTAGVWLLRRLDSSFGLDAYVLTSKGGLIPSSDGRVQLPKEHSHTTALVEAGNAGSIAEVIKRLSKPSASD